MIRKILYISILLGLMGCDGDRNSNVSKPSNFVQPVPEPSSIILFGAGLIAIGIAVGRTKK